MAVIVMGMDMTDRCRWCDVCMEDKYATYRCPLVGEEVEDNRQKHSDCPLKSIEGLIEILEKSGGDDKKAFCKSLNASYKQGLKDAIKIIKEYCRIDKES